MIAHHSFKLNGDMIYLIETLKVEGYWSKKYFTLTLQNKDMPLLNNIERIVKNLDIKINKRILLKIRLDNNTEKENIKIILDNEELKFHIETSPFDNNKVKAVTSLPYKRDYQITLIYNKRKISINIKVNKNEIIVKSKLDCWVYGDLRFPTKDLLNFLEDYCGNKKEFHLEEFLINSNGRLVMSAFSALVDCEGSVDHYDLFRKIRIRMRNKDYLSQWKDLLAKWDIKARLQKNNEKEFELCIEGWQDFNRLNELGFKLFHSKKSKKWGDILNGFKRNQISRNSYRAFYLKKLRELNKKITAQEFANHLNKSKRVINHYLLKLEKEKLVKCNRTVWPYLYFI